jgi:hypothetical protein
LYFYCFRIPIFCLVPSEYIFLLIEKISNFGLHFSCSKKVFIYSKNQHESKNLIIKTKNLKEAKPAAADRATAVRACHRPAHMIATSSMTSGGTESESVVVVVVVVVAETATAAVDEGVVHHRWQRSAAPGHALALASHHAHGAKTTSPRPVARDLDHQLLFGGIATTATAPLLTRTAAREKGDAAARGPKSNANTAVARWSERRRAPQVPLAKKARVEAGVAAAAAAARVAKSSA